jgi:hypothetical protein
MPPAALQAFVSTPCFFWNLCTARAVLEKAGRAVCRGCAGRLRGREYPLRRGSEAALYLTGRVAAEELDMIEDSERAERAIYSRAFAQKLRGLAAKHAGQSEGN